MYAGRQAVQNLPSHFFIRWPKISVHFVHFVISVRFGHIEYPVEIYKLG